MRRKPENHMVQLTKDDLATLMDSQDIFDVFGNPVAIKGDSGVEWILMSVKYYKRMQGENRDYETMLERPIAIDFSRKQGPCVAEQRAGRSNTRQRVEKGNSGPKWRRQRQKSRGGEKLRNGSR